jgi:DNA-binding response OmpR family regulator
LARRWRSHIAGKKILIVEDDAGLRQVLVDILTIEGWEATSARTGSEALSILSNGKFDFALLDIGLPDISGWQVLDDTRESMATTKFVVLSASTTESSRQRALRAGAVDYIVKPVAMRDLVNQLEQHLS